MKKTVLIALLGFSLTLIGCVQQTPAENQDISQPTLNVNQSTNQPAVNLNQGANTNQPTANVNQNVNTNTNKPVDAYADWRTYTHPFYGWKIKYPKDWQFKEFNQSIAFAPQNISLEQEWTSGAIVWIVYQNPDQLSLEEFFNGTNQPNYFNDAANGIANITVDGVLSKKFNGVPGMVAYTISTIPKGAVIVELRDNGEKHKTDGIYDMMLQSIDF